MRKLATGPWLALLLPIVLSFSAPERLSAAGSAVHVAPVPGAIPKDTTRTFPVTPVGQTSTICAGLCYCSGPCPSNGCDASGSGTARSSHFPSPPFGASGFRLEPYTHGGVDCRAGIPVQLPVTVGVGQQIAFTLSFSPSRPGTFTDYFDVDGFIFNLAGSTPRGSASLVPYQPAGWSAPVVVSRTQGTQVDSPTLTSAEPLYVSWAVQNAGDLSTFGTFYIDLYLDGAFLQRWSWADSLAPRSYIYLKDYRIGPLPTGTHTLQLVPDTTHTIGSSNNFTKTFSVGQPGPPPKPATSASWYIQATGRYNKDSTLYAWAFQAGQQGGQLHESTGDNELVILFFGQPWKSSNGIYGASGFGRPLTVSQIAGVIKQFVLGYETATQYGLFLAAGTSNNGPYVTEAHAKAWAKMLVDLDGWLTKQGFSGVHLSSASDAELSFTAGPQKTQAWFRTFDDEIARNRRFIFNYDFGDAEACPTTVATSAPQPCGTTGWTQKDIADLFALYIPQIYNNSTALEWAQISLYIALRSGQSGGLIQAPLTQKGACTPPRAGCNGTSNTPLQAWRQLGRALNSSPNTASQVQDLLWSTDINWNTNKNQ